MHPTNESERARLMAQWRATGGACQPRAGETRRGDDGLQAGQATRLSRGCGGMADDGLAAGYITTIQTCGRVDDGLEAAGPTALTPNAPICGIDDGLEASGPTALTPSAPICGIDDGLAAGSPSWRGTGLMCADDGLMAQGGSFLHGDCFADDGRPAA